MIGPDDKSLHVTSVNLYRADQYRKGASGIYGYQGPHGRDDEDWRSFQFDHLPAGDYILVFNDSDRAEPESPFHRTFYPRAAKAEDAQIIHLAAGQQVTNADIHLGEAGGLREITVRIVWSGREPASWVPVSIVAEGYGTRTWPTKPDEDRPNTYALALWQGVQYTIQATAPCRTGGANEAKTNTVTVDGDDSSASVITLTFDKGWCEGK